ncbi:MAG TPA: hypothetical protein VH394_21055 [Thermoanaerobaculia bacterium]|jgi:hypothetical protein|nr:hypothetical protein [Thermoanaerobaculia bacterium]
MCSEPQDGAVRRSRRWALVASILLVGGLAAGKARGDIYVHVMNCAAAFSGSTTIEAEAYDAKDSVRVTPASSKDITTGNNEQLHCAGEGEGYCQMHFKFKGNPDQCYGNETSGQGLHVDSGKWAVIYGYQVGGGFCSPDVKQVDTQPSDCYSVCGQCRD